MSGGHFNFGDYIYYRVAEFADELESEINNNTNDKDGWCPNFNEETILYLKEKLPEIRRLAKIMKEIDYLYSGDHGEDSFLKAVSND